MKQSESRSLLALLSPFSATTSVSIERHSCAMPSTHETEVAGRAAGDGAALLHGSEVWALLPQPCLGSGGADGDRASRLRHTVEGMDGDVHLGRPTLVRVRAQPVTDELSEPADGRLGSGLFRVSGGFLPGCPSVLGDVRRTSRSDVLKMAVPLCGCGLGRIARHGRGTRRHHDRRFGMRLGDGGGDAVLVVCTVAGERGHRSRHLMDKRPTSAPSSTSLVVSAAATICPVSASRPMCRLRQDRRVLARRLRVEWSGTARRPPRIACRATICWPPRRGRPWSSRNAVSRPTFAGSHGMPRFRSDQGRCVPLGRAGLRVRHPSIRRSPLTAARSGTGRADAALLDEFRADGRSERRCRHGVVSTRPAKPCWNWVMRPGQSACSILNGRRCSTRIVQSDCRHRPTNWPRSSQTVTVFASGRQSGKGTLTTMATMPA